MYVDKENKISTKSYVDKENEISTNFYDDKEPDFRQKVAEKIDKMFP
jgi:hypothetical protein